MQFFDRSILLAAAALAFAQSAVAVPLQDLAEAVNPTDVAAPLKLLSERAAPTGYNGSGVYTVTNVATGTRLTLLNGGTAKGTPIVGWQNTGDQDPHQQWRINEISSLGPGWPAGLWKSFTNVGSGTIIAADPGVDAGAANKLVGWTSPASYLHQVWYITTPFGDGSVSFVNGKYWAANMDLDHSNSANGTPVLCFPATDNPNQHWILNKIGN